MPGDPGATVVTNSCASIVSHARLRVHLAPGIPHALYFRGREIQASLGRFASRERESVFVIASQRVGAKRRPMTGSAKQSMDVRGGRQMWTTTAHAGPGNVR